MARVPSPRDSREAVRSRLSRSPGVKEIGRMARVEQRRSHRQVEEPSDAQAQAPDDEDPVDDGWVPPWEI